MTPGGFTAGDQTLIGEMMRGSGLKSAAATPWFEAVSLEKLVLQPPRLLVLGFFDAVRGGRWAPGRHPLVARLAKDRAVASLPGSMLGCPAWFAADGSARPGRGGADAMKRLGLNLALGLALAVTAVAAVTLGETPLSLDQYLQGLTQPGSAPWEILWTIRAPRAVAAAVVGACLGLSGGLLQGLLRNPLADPGVLGVSATAALGAALTIVMGLAAIPGAVEVSALLGAALAGAGLLLFAARFPEPEALILFGVALSSFAGAVTALVFNLSPSPIATAEVLAWLLGSVENRNWLDVAWAAVPLALAGLLAAHAGRGLLALTLGEETAATTGLPMRRLKLAAVAAASIATGAAVALAGVIGFVGLAAPHLVRAAVREDPSRLLLPSALSGALMLVLADLAARTAPTEVELKLGVFTALVGAPLFAFVAWRAARSWRS